MELREDFNKVIDLMDHNRNLIKNGGTKSELGNIQIGLVTIAIQSFGYTSPVAASVQREAHRNPEEFGDEAPMYKSSLADYNIYMSDINKAIKNSMQDVQPTVIASNSLIKK